MISTVTTATVDTVTTVTAAILGGLGILASLMLFGMLVSKEVVSVSQDSRLQAFGKALNVAIVPLLLGVLLMAAMKVIQLFF